MAADTDGVDGSEDNAGAFADGGSAARMRAAGVDPAAALARDDAWSAFAAAGDLYVTGPHRDQCERSAGHSDPLRQSAMVSARSVRRAA